MTYALQLQQQQEEGGIPQTDTEIKAAFWAAIPKRFPAAMDWLHRRTRLFLRSADDLQRWDFPVDSRLGRELERILGVDLVRSLIEERFGVQLQYTATGQLYVASQATALPALPLDSIDVEALFAAYPAAAAELRQLAVQAKADPHAVVEAEYRPSHMVAQGMFAMLTVATQREAVAGHLGITLGWMHCCGIRATISGTIERSWQSQYDSQVKQDFQFRC